MRFWRAALSAAAFVAAGLAASAALASQVPVTIGGPANGPILDKKGTGLCEASAISPDPQKDFSPLFSNPVIYNGGMNSFMENHAGDRVEHVVRTVLDLSNNLDDGSPAPPSFGDFWDAMSPTCKKGGCNFVFNDPSGNTAFGSRFRGFLNVTDDLVGKPLHFGFMADQGVSLVFFDDKAKVYLAAMHAPDPFITPWRVTNTVTFTEAGLYPLEILYMDGAGSSALEFSMLDGMFTDQDNDFNKVGQPQLDTGGFKLFQPDVFFHTLSGDPSFPDLNKCQQCDRANANAPGNGGCQSGYYCNGAALCAPCSSDTVCGPTCSPCMGDTPFCVNLNGQNVCGGCRDDFDCKEGFSCDPVKHVCNECDENSQCPHGKICENHACVPCSAPDVCAGNSCNCCPLGSNGKQMQCKPLDPGPDAWPMCVECVSTADCDTGLICDVFVGRCVKQLPENEQAEGCGVDKVVCAQQDPVGLYNYCLPGPVGTACAQCRNDMDCTPTNVPEGTVVDAKFCLSGECTACIKDRRCGDRCESCGGDTPYCLGQTSANAKCVRCTNDSQCAGGKCNEKTNECEPSCPAACTVPTPYCDGEKCVECYADTQCPCGGTCELGTHTCSHDCKSNVDCLGTDHCKWSDNEVDKECAQGPMPGDVACGGTLATICDSSIVGGKGRRQDGNAPVVGIIGLSLLALLGRRRIRGNQ